MRHSFYDSEEYKARQRAHTKLLQEKGVYEHLKRRSERMCLRDGCGELFLVQEKDPKRFCGRSCAATVSNSKRTVPSDVRKKISDGLKGNTNTQGLVRFEPITSTCANDTCKKTFTYKRFVHRRFCSVLCAMRVIGAHSTSPKASRGKAGIRRDIDPAIYFYSRWEANMARLYTYLGVPWVFEPETFDIGNQTYTPDFYLPDEGIYIEVKNFWSEYSRLRDEKFRERYPDLQLKVILKDEYLALEKQYAHQIPEWEYRNSAFKKEKPRS